MSRAKRSRPRTQRSVLQRLTELEDRVGGLEKRIMFYTFGSSVIAQLLAELINRLGPHA